MRKLIVCIAFVMFLSTAGFAQVREDPPGVSGANLQLLREAKKVMQFPVPTWLPTGFKLEKVDLRLGSEVPVQDRVLTLVYSRRLPSGDMQRFAIEAGFDGLGDLPYETTKVIRSPIGKIELAYEPADPDDGGKKLTDYVLTQWFTVGRTAFHYDGMYAPDNTKLAMISLADTEKILGSLKRF